MATTRGDVPVQVDMLSRDYESIRADIFELAPLVTPNWTDFSASEPMVMLAEAMSYIGDNLSYYQDRWGNESYLGTCQLKQSAAKITKFNFGYAMKAAMSATVVLDIDFDAAFGAGYPYTLPVGTVFQTVPIGNERPKYYATEADIIIPAAGVNNVITTHGNMVRDEILGSGNGKAYQEFTPKYYPISMDSSGRASLKVYVFNGAIWVQWTEVDDFFDSLAADEHYKLDWAEDNSVTVIFGDNLTGAICPMGADNVRCTYRVGGGLIGNEAAIDSITKVVDSALLQANGGPIISVTNIEAPSGGKERETVAEARVNARKEKRTQSRCVDYRDYEAACFKYPGGGVAKAKAWKGRGPFETVIMIASEGSTPNPTGNWNPITEAGAGLLGGLGAYLNAQKVGPMWIQMRGPKIVKPKIKANILLASNIYQTDGYEAIVTAFDSLFNFTNRVFGESADLGATYKAVKDLVGVERIDIEEHHRVPYAEYIMGTEFVVFSQMNMTQATKKETWTIEFISDTFFEVRGTLSGKQAALGVCNGAKFTVDNGSFSFRASFNIALGTAATKGTRFQINTGQWLDNIDITYEEIIVAGEYDFRVTGGIG